jgi:hypothetical protein
MPTEKPRQLRSYGSVPPSGPMGGRVTATCSVIHGRQSGSGVFFPNDQGLKELLRSKLALSLAIYSQRVTPLIAIEYPGRSVRKPRSLERNLDGPSAALVSERTCVVGSWKEQPWLRVASKAMRRRTACRRAIKLQLLDREFSFVPKGQDDTILVCLTFEQRNRTSNRTPGLAN